MNDNNIYFNNGVDCAINQMYNKENKFVKMANEIENKYGEEASSSFKEGYYLALAYFTHAISHFHDSPKHLEEKFQIISELHGNKIKEAFIRGLEYYKKQDEEAKSTSKKK